MSIWKDGGLFAPRLHSRSHTYSIVQRHVSRDQAKTQNKLALQGRCGLFPVAHKKPARSIRIAMDGKTNHSSQPGQARPADNLDTQLAAIVSVTLSSSYRHLCECYNIDTNPLPTPGDGQHWPHRQCTQSIPRPCRHRHNKLNQENTAVNREFPHDSR